MWPHQDARIRKSSRFIAFHYEYTTTYSWSSKLPQQISAQTMLHHTSTLNEPFRVPFWPAVFLACFMPFLFSICFVCPSAEIFYRFNSFHLALAHLARMPLGENATNVGSNPIKTLWNGTREKVRVKRASWWMPLRRCGAIGHFCEQRVAGWIKMRKRRIASMPLKLWLLSKRMPCSTMAF